MPFDGYSQNIKALVLIDALLDYYALGTRKRRKGAANVDLLMTLHMLRKQQKITGDNTRTYLLQAAATPTLAFRYLYDLNQAIPNYEVLERILFRARELILGKEVSAWTWQHRTPRPREVVCCPDRARFIRGGIDEQRNPITGHGCDPRPHIPFISRSLFSVRSQ